MVRLLRNGRRLVWVAYCDATGHSVGHVVSTVKGFTIFKPYAEPVTFPTLAAARAALQDRPAIPPADDRVASTTPKDTTP